MARLLITGASGLLGANLVLAARGEHRVSAVSRRRAVAVDGVRSHRVDLVRPAAVEALVEAERPEAIIHCAAAADVDVCERDPEAAMGLNADVPRRLATVAAQVGARLIHISTDAVFDGTRGGYREDDEPRPINAYGRSKHAGEQAVLEAGGDALVLRTNFFGWHPWGRRGLAEWFLHRLQAGQAAPGFTDVRISPLLVNDLARFLLELVDRAERGLYHLAGGECVTKFEFGRRLAQAFDLPPGGVEPATVDRAELAAPRPHNLCLDSSRLAGEAGFSLPGLDEGLAAFRSLAEAGYPRRLRSILRPAAVSASAAEAAD